MSKLILGDGLLGKEIVKQTGWNYISRKEHDIDFTKPETYDYLIKTFDVIVNCIAHTDTYDKDRQKHWDINYKGVIDLVDICNKYNKKLIHISTDYIYTNSKEEASEEDVPVHCDNWYGYTKLLSDSYVQVKSNNYLLGDKVSLADIAIFPFIRQFAFVDIDWFESSRYIKLREWLSTILGSKIFNIVMKKTK